MAVVVLLAVVVVSYRQVVRAYPSGGGSYEVATKNLGRSAGLVVAGALLVDYVMTVAVSVAAGVDNDRHPMTRILVVDDDPQLLRALRVNLTARHYDVLTAPDGTTGLTLASHSRPDLAIIDLGLPDIDSVTVVEGLRGWSTTPIIVLSTRHHETVKVNALDAGADDYITKPFGMDELLARVRAALRRTASAVTTQTPTVTTDAFTVDLANKRVTTPAGQVRLTPTEWHLLEVLTRHPGRLVTHQQLLNEVWGPQYTTETNYLRVHIANLRRKLEPDPAQPRYVLTDPGIGYHFAA